MTSESLKPYILVVDDNDLSRNNLIGYCKKSGCKVQAFNSVKLAIDSFQENDYDIIVTDCDFPDLNREELFNALSNSTHQIIALSDNYSVKQAISAIKSGAIEFLKKPVDFDEFTDSINKVTNQKKELELKKFIKKCKYSFEFPTDKISTFNLFQSLGFIFNENLISKQKLLEVQLAFQEALCNSIEHGNLELKSEWKEIINAEGIDNFALKKKERLADSKYKDRKIFLELEINDNSLIIKIEDQGQGFLKNEKKEVNNDEIKPYGRGMTLINNNMDDVKFLKNGKLQILKKFI